MWLSEIGEEQSFGDLPVKPCPRWAMPQASQRGAQDTGGNVPGPQELAVGEIGDCNLFIDCFLDV